MQSAEISSRALRFFEQRGHAVVPSASLIADDPTLLVINAGMAPFKPYFLGEAPAPFRRATSVQKCVRTVDIEEVGRTSRHGSFFQMFGNFSFGDYFKEKAIPYAWEFLTTPVADGGLGLPESRLWVTVYTDDDEAEHIWRTTVGVPAERIQRLGMAENFWSMGVPGPCGPCSEICFDRGPEYGREGGPIADDERYLEIWNLVFMQHIRGEGPAKEGYPILGGLPAKNIDTGLGLERMAALLQSVDTIFDIDTTREILDLAAELCGARYGKTTKDDVALRVVADHILTSVMLIGDGVTPSNEGRGYILRRILRRAVRAMRVLGSQEPVVHDLVTRAITVMSPAYPELGLVEGRFGGGYYVRKYRPIIRHSLQRLAEGPRDAGRAIWDADPGTAGRDLLVDRVQVSNETPPGDVANDLGVDASARAVVRRRRYVLDGKPVLLSTSYFPADIASGTRIEHRDTGPGGVYARLAEAGRPPEWFQEDVTARMPSPDEAEQLRLTPGTPVLAVRRAVWGPAGRGLEVNAMVADAGAYVLRYRWVAARPDD